MIYVQLLLNIVTIGLLMFVFFVLDKIGNRLHEVEIRKKRKSKTKQNETQKSTFFTQD